MRVEDSSHPVTAGVNGYIAFDERHTVQYHLDKEPLPLRPIAPDNLAAAGGWWRERGKGRCGYRSPAHTPQALNHPMMQRLMRNAAEWLVWD